FPVPLRGASGQGDRRSRSVQGRQGDDRGNRAGHPCDRACDAGSSQHVFQARDQERRRHEGAEGAGAGDAHRGHHVSGIRRPDRAYAVWQCLYLAADRRGRRRQNGVNVYLANKHYEVAPVMSMTEHEANNSLVWVSDKLWNSLTPEQQGWVQAAADEVNRNQPAKAVALEHESAAKLKSIGVKIVTDVDKSGFQKI